MRRDGDSLKGGRSVDRIPVGERLFALVQTGPGAHPASSTMGIESLSHEQSGRGVALTTHLHLAPRLKKEQRYTLYSPSVPSRCVLKWILPYFIFFCNKLTLENLTVIQRARLFTHRLPQIATVSNVDSCGNWQYILWMTLLTSLSLLVVYIIRL